jgi:hypothetical protein
MQGPTADSEAEAIAAWDALPRVGDGLYVCREYPEEGSYEAANKDEAERIICNECVKDIDCEGPRKLSGSKHQLRRWTAVDGTPPDGEYIAYKAGEIDITVAVRVANGSAQWFDARVEMWRDCALRSIFLSGRVLHSPIEAEGGAER